MISTVFGNTGQDFFKYPVLEFLCAFELAAENQAVHVRLFNHADFLHSTFGLKGVVFYHPLTELLDSVGRVFVAERECHIAGNKQRVFAVGDDADVVGFK